MRKSSLAVSALSLLPESARRRNLIEKAVLETFRLEKSKIPGDISVVFLDRARMKSLNKRFLNHSHDTDVIAFNYDQDFPGAPFGDIYISAYQARRQAEEMGHPILKEVLTLVIHGTLHLLGYDDATPRQKAVMFKKQDVLLARLK